MGYNFTLVDDRIEASEEYEKLNEFEKNKSVIELENFIVGKIKNMEK